MILGTDKKLLFTDRGIVTIWSIWDFELQQYLELSADCPFSGHRFAPPAKVLAAIEKITEKADLRPKQSPCLKLSDEYSA